MRFSNLLIEYIVYPFMERFKNNQIRPFIKELKANERLSEPQLKSLQDRKLKDILLHCVQNIPAYKDQRPLTELINKDPYTALEQFPLLTKTVFNANAQAYLDPSFPAAELIAISSGGSTGQPVSFYIDRLAVEHYEASRWRGLSWWGITPSSRSLMVWGHPLGLTENESLKFRLKERVLKNRTMISAYALDIQKARDYGALLNTYQPDYLYGYASSLTAFAELLEHKGIKIKTHLKGVVSTAEMLHDHQREILHRVFKAPVINEYGAKDGGIIAYQCPAGQMHLSTDNLVIEIIEESSGRRVEPGETGLVVITDLYNRAMPRLRYVVGDLARLSSAPCSCGLGLPVLEAIEGREADTFMGQNGQLVYGGYWNCMIRDMKGIKQFQLIQHDPDHVTLRIVKGQAYDQAEVDRIIDEIQTVLGVKSVAMVHCDRIEPSPSGKIRYAIREYPLSLDLSLNREANAKTS
ncbi:MAG: phenylacetate--CoA ligase family protein [Ignavibacteriales bacterium]